MLKITVFYDYVCPYCLLAKVPFDEAITNYEAQITYVPYELTEEPTPRIDVYHDEKRRKDWENIIIPTSQRLGISIKLPHIIPRPYTRMAIEGSYYAREQGKEPSYHTRIFQAYFVEEQDIGDLEVLIRLAKEVGLDPVAYRNAITNLTYTEHRMKDVNYAKRVHRVRQIPTYIVNGEVVQNVYDKETFEQIFSRVSK